MLKVVILGAGASAFYSWYAAITAGYRAEEVEIWGGKTIVPPGAFWLHKLPPTVKSIAEPIKVYLEGDSEIYSIKQWGKVYPSSWNSYLSETTWGYNPYYWLPVLRQQCNVRNLPSPLEPSQIHELSLSPGIEFVIQTFPTDPGTLELLAKYKFPIVVEPSNNSPCMTYNGQEHTHWVRKFSGWGFTNTEYPISMSSETDKILHWHTSAATIRMVSDIPPWILPVENQKIGKEKNIILTGRWALCDRKFLSHMSFGQVYFHLTGTKYVWM